MPVKSSSTGKSKPIRLGKSDAQTDIITFGFDIGEFRENKIYVKLNKPVGYVVSAQEKEGPTVFELVADCPQKVFPIGRLDKDSSGLLLFTSDTTLTARLIGEDSDCEKEYYVKTVSPIDDDDLERMRRGMTILGEMTQTGCCGKTKRQFVSDYASGRQKPSDPPYVRIRGQPREVFKTHSVRRYSSRRSSAWAMATFRRRRKKIS